MKKQMTLQELATELQKQNIIKRDFVVPASMLRFQNGELVIVGNKHNSVSEILNAAGIATDDSTTYKTTDSFDRQIAAKLEIPMPYFKRMRELISDTNAPSDILDKNVNEWLKRWNGNFLIRTFENADDNTYIARAFLGDRYRMLDNIDILFSALDAIKRSGVRLEIESCDLTDTRMYVRFICPDVVIQSPELLKNYRVPNGRRAPEGDNGIMAGFILSNSETGHGSTFIAPRLVVNACSNGMVFKQDSQRHVHLGGRLQETNAIDWSANTREKNIQLIMAQIGDAITTYLNPEYLGKSIDALVNEGQTKIENPVDAITNVARDLMFSDDSQKQLLSYFMTGGDYTGFGVVQAITYFAHDAATDADERYELEAVAVDYINPAKYDKQIVASDKPRRKSNKSFSQN